MQKLLKRAAVLLVLLAFVGMLLPAGGAAEADPEEVDEITIALVAPFTGLGSILGEYIQRGANLAVREINEAGGVMGAELVLRVYDTAADASTAGTVIRRAILEDGAVAVFGPNMSSAVLGVHDLAEQNQVPMLVGATSPSLRYTEHGNPYLFRLRSDDQVKVEILVEYAIEELGIENPGIIYGSTDFTIQGYRVARETYEAMGYEVAGSEQMREGDTDATGQLLSLEAAGMDGLIGLTHEPEGAVVVSQMRELEIDVPIIGFSAWGVPAFSDLAGRAAHGVYSVQSFNPNDPSEAVQSFVEAHVAQFGQRPSDPGPCYYDGVKLLAAAIEQAQSLDGEVLAQALREIEFEGVQGPMKADEHHNFTDLSYIAQYNYDEDDWEVIDIIR